MMKIIKVFEKNIASLISIKKWSSILLIKVIRLKHSRFGYKKRYFYPRFGKKSTLNISRLRAFRYNLFISYHPYN